MERLSYNVSSLLANAGAKQQISLSEVLEPVQRGSDTVSFAGPLVGQLNLENIGGPLRIRGRLRAAVTLDCYRCLRVFKYPLVLEIDEILTESQGEDVGDEEALRIVDETVKLMPLIEQAMLLNLPMKLLCRSDCEGLCPSCGRNLNESSCDCSQEEIDPRMAKLKLLIQDEEHSETSGE